jgi:hypothetical protein
MKFCKLVGYIMDYVYYYFYIFLELINMIFHYLK